MTIFGALMWPIQTRSTELSVTANAPSEIIVALSANRHPNYLQRISITTESL